MSAPFIFMILNFVVLLATASKFGRAAPRARSPPSATIRSRPRSTRPPSSRKQAADKLAEYDKRAQGRRRRDPELVDRIREAAAEADKNASARRAEAPGCAR